MTPNEIVGTISKRIGQPFDVPLQQEIKALMHPTRAMLMKQALAKRPYDRQLFMQSFVAEVKHVSKIECPITYGCTLRTVKKLPAPLRGTGGIYDYFGSADFEVPYGIGGSWKEGFFKYRKYTSKNTRYELRDQYGFISDTENAIEYVGVIGVFDNPEDLKEFKCSESDDSPCYSDDKPYPMPGDLIDPLITHILTTKFGMIIPDKRTEVKVDPRTS